MRSEIRYVDQDAFQTVKSRKEQCPSKTLSDRKRDKQDRPHNTVVPAFARPEKLR